MLIKERQKTDSTWMLIMQNLALQMFNDKENTFSITDGLHGYTQTRYRRLVYNSETSMNWFCLKENSTGYDWESLPDIPGALT